MECSYKRWIYATPYSAQMKSIILWFHSSLVKWSIFSALTYSRQLKPNIFSFVFYKAQKEQILDKVAFKFYRASISQDIFVGIRKFLIKLNILGSNNMYSSDLRRISTWKFAYLWHFLLPPVFESITLNTSKCIMYSI